MLEKVPHPHQNWEGIPDASREEALKLHRHKKVLNATVACRLEDTI